MESKLTIVGVTQYKGDVEGTHYDQTKVIILLPFSRNKKTAKQGYDAKVSVYGDHTNFKQFDGRKFPMVCDCEYEVTDTGIDVYDIKLPPLQQAAQQQQPAKS